MSKRASKRGVKSKIKFEIMHHWQKVMFRNRLNMGKAIHDPEEDPGYLV